MALYVTHSKPSNWSPHDHEVLVDALDNFSRHGAPTPGHYRDALFDARRDGASKRVLESITSRYNMLRRDAYARKTKTA